MSIDKLATGIGITRSIQGVSDVDEPQVPKNLMNTTKGAQIVVDWNFNNMPSEQRQKIEGAVRGFLIAKRDDETITPRVQVLLDDMAKTLVEGNFNCAGFDEFHVLTEAFSDCWRNCYIGAPMYREDFVAVGDAIKKALSERS